MLLDSLNELYENGRRKYIYAFEKRSVIRKKAQYLSINWSAGQQEAFDKYWISNYGRKIPNNWHKLYESINGTFCIDYFPEILFTSELEPKWNRVDYCKVLRDKSFLQTIYGRSDFVRVPETYVLFSGKYCYDFNQRIISYEKALSILNNIREAIIKPTIAHGSGRNVIIVDFVNGKDLITGKKVESILSEYGTNFIIQERVPSHILYSKIYPDAINTVRIMTYIIDDMIYHAPIVLRIGSGGSWIDNIHAGGFGVGVNDDGTLEKYGYRLGNDGANIKVIQHPDTAFVFEGNSVPGIDKIIQAAHKLHGRTPCLGTVAWDFCIDKNELPVLIEANYKSNGVWLPQIVNSKSLFGDNTVKILQFLRKTK